MKKIFVVAAHPDDEVLGCGGTILKHISNGDKVYVLFVSEGVSGRYKNIKEKNFIKLMKRATNLIVKARTIKGAETTDHYSMMGFTKAYNTAKKTCG